MLTITKEYLIVNNHQEKIKEFEDAYNSHPNFPSLFALTDSLNLVNVENIAARVDKVELENLPSQFLAMIEDELFLVKKHNSKIVLLDNKKETTEISVEEFVSKWNGIIVGIEEGVKEDVSMVSFYNILILSSLLLFGVFFIKQFLDSDFNVISNVVFLLSLIGTILGVLIVSEKYYNVNGHIVSKLCGQGESMSCEDVVNSKLAQINKWLEFSDLPIVYFSSAIMAMLLVPTVYQEIILMSVFTIPVVFYSLWLQKVKINKWCPLCLLVSSVLVISSLLTLIKPYHFNWNNWYVFLVSFLSLFAVWSVFKNLLLEKNKLDTENVSLRKFKRNPDLFFKSIVPVSSPISLFNFNKIVIGDQEASVTLSLLLSPSCPHCHTAYKKAINLQKRFKKSLKLEILYNVNPENTLNQYREVALVLLQLNRENKENSLEALDDWHSKQMSLKEWKNKWQRSIEPTIVNDLEDQYNWCQENNFNYAPVRLINENLLPNEYDIEDLKFFISELIFEEVY